ncbi:MAG: PPOX class F420-dependent oxidoreductase [Ktedonobacteraceae bacterium]
MSQQIPDKALDLFQKPALANLATIMPDGTPQVTPVWVDFDGTYVRINTAKGRRKTINMEQNPKVGLDIIDPSNDFHWISIRGHIAEITEEGANDHINQLSHKYTGGDYQGFRVGEVRVICKMTLDRVIVG